jgi:dipeptidyl aminopeptidase/acylaminoacyl peptidase
MSPDGFSKDGRTLLATRRESVSPLRVLSLADGEPHTVNGSDSDPLGWTPDSNGLLFTTSLDGRRAVLRTSVSGGAMAEVRFPERPAGFEVTDLRRAVPSNLVLSGDGRSLLYAVPGPAPDTTTLMVLDMEAGRSRVLTERHPIAGAFMSGRVQGPGGSVNRDSDEFFFWEKEGEALVLKAADPMGETRVLRQFDDPENSVSIAVFENRLAFLEHADGEASILLADAGGGESRRILTVDGFLDMLVWSPDGRWLAGTHWPKDGTGAKTMLLRVSEDGEVDGEPRFPGPDAGSWWGHQWLPDSSGFLATGTHGDVWLMPVDPLVEPVSVTDEEVGEISSFLLSPDGRTIAYAPYLSQGSSIWLLDLGDALVGGRSR